MMHGVTCGIPADWAHNFSQCLYDWQALEGAGLALVAAGVSIWAIQKQIRQAQDHRDDDISRRHTAARVTLPLALAAVSELAQTIADHVADEFDNFEPDGSRTIEAVLDKEIDRTRFEPISLPHDVLGSFEDFVASLERSDDIRHVAELMASIQILLSRYNSFDFKQAAVQLSLVGLLLDAAKVKLLNEKIYNYARFVDDSAFGIVGVMPFANAWDEIHRKATGLLFHRQWPEPFFPELKKRIDGYKERNTTPWHEKFEPL
jgi:hypothetical protein